MEKGNFKLEICYIFAAGDFCGNISKNIGDYVIAADAGYNHLERLGISPDMIVGDFDTIGLVPEHENIKTFPKEKDYTDSELALLEGIRLGYKKFVICGALGGKRLEHTIANISLAASYAELGYEITLTDGLYFVSAIHNASVKFDESNKGFVSVFPFNGNAEGVDEIGLKYSIRNATLDISRPTLGVSNEFTTENAVISVKNGTLIIIWQNSNN